MGMCSEMCTTLCQGKRLMLLARCPDIGLLSQGLAIQTPMGICQYGHMNQLQTSVSLTLRPLLRVVFRQCHMCSRTFVIIGILTVLGKPRRKKRGAWCNQIANSHSLSEAAVL